MNIIKEILKKVSKVSSVSVHYTDEYKTLHQAFMVTKKEVVESKGKVLNYLISEINPNLNWLYEIMSFDKNKIPIKTTYFNRDGSINREIIYDKEKGWIIND